MVNRKICPIRSLKIPKPYVHRIEDEIKMNTPLRPLLHYFEKFSLFTFFNIHSMLTFLTNNPEISAIVGNYANVTEYGGVFGCGNIVH